MRVEHKLGITPVLKRLAWFYAKKGVGSHAVEPPHDAFYDEVIVRELYEWHAPEGREDLPPQGGLVVEFVRVGERVRWVEFAARYVGGGGESILREV